MTSLHCVYGLFPHAVSLSNEKNLRKTCWEIACSWVEWSSAVWDKCRSSQLWFVSGSRCRWRYYWGNVCGVQWRHWTSRGSLDIILEAFVAENNKQESLFSCWSGMALPASRLIGSGISSTFKPFCEKAPAIKHLPVTSEQYSSMDCPSIRFQIQIQGQHNSRNWLAWQHLITVQLSDNVFPLSNATLWLHAFKIWWQK